MGVLSNKKSTNYFQPNNLLYYDLVAKFLLHFAGSIFYNILSNSVIMLLNNYLKTSIICC